MLPVGVTTAAALAATRRSYAQLDASFDILAAEYANCKNRLMLYRLLSRVVLCSEARDELDASDREPQTILWRCLVINIISRQYDLDRLNIDLEDAIEHINSFTVREPEGEYYSLRRHARVAIDTGNVDILVRVVDFLVTYCRDFFVAD